MITIIKKGTPLEDIRKAMKKATTKPKSKGIIKFSGKLKINQNPLDIQKKMRDEWE
ncbi:hypothetical protein [Marinigracilibium pacificum]|uniref:Uncharacterized protein n=1 Tax=Marinigracilibium pacificum TaxID=2729599 RepID=A0A848JCP5_9BACT|nr:hypothetical protein [Marinigracilibium pacificum]NMM50772.1 hypothetical protein [Marinigracilibium pacificum]